MNHPGDATDDMSNGNVVILTVITVIVVRREQVFCGYQFSVRTAVPHGAVLVVLGTMRMVARRLPRSISAEKVRGPAVNGLAVLVEATTARDVEGVPKL